MPNHYHIIGYYTDNKARISFKLVFLEICVKVFYQNCEKCLQKCGQRIVLVKSIYCERTFFQPIYSLKLLYKIVHYIFNNPKKWNEIGRTNTEEGVKYFNSSAHDIVHFEFVENLMNLDDLKKDILLFAKAEEEVLKIADQNLQYWKRKDEIKLLKCDASKPWGCLTDGLDEFEEDLVLKAVKKNGPKGKNEKTRELARGSKLIRMLEKVLGFG